jgi:RNA polymerase sigma factor (sigma-70 family)
MMYEGSIPGVAEPGVLVASFDELFKDQYDAVVRIAFSLTGRWSVAEELAQEAFLEAHTRWATVGAFDKPGAWVRRVVINRSLSSLRRSATEAKLLLRLSGLRRSNDTAMPDAADELWRAVRSLPMRQAEVIALRVVEDMSIDDIADVLGCNVETVRTHLLRARRTLAARLGEPNDEPHVATLDRGDDES